MTASASRRPRLSGPRLASTKAADFWTSLRIDMTTLQREIVDLGATPAATAPALPAGNDLYADRASADIDAMLTGVRVLRDQARELRRAARQAATVAALGDDLAGVIVADRLYERDGEVYRTVLSGQGNLYAKIWTGDGWDYAAGAIRDLRPAHRMTVDRAVALSLRIGRCIRCAALLTAEESVARGIGPVCITKI